MLDPAWAQRAQQLANDAARMAFGDQIPVRVEVVPGQLDPRLSLAPCQKVDVFMPAGQRAWGRTRIGLKCLQGPVAWSVTLPLTVRLWAPALVAAGPLPAGTVLSPSHLRMSEVDWAERASPVLVSTHSSPRHACHSARFVDRVMTQRRACSFESHAASRYPVSSPM